jgi:hypothetical protein
MVCRHCYLSNREDAQVCSGCNRPLPRLEPKQAEVAQPGFGEARRGPAKRAVTVADSGVAWGEPEAALEQHDRHTGPEAGSENTKRITVFDPRATERARESNEGEAGACNKPPAPPRKIVGVLVTYSWTNAGQIFPILEGRNRIGRDPSRCDVAIPQDETLSAINSHIVFRKTFTIGDDVSMCGTDVDGDPIETAFVPLRNYARIRTGSTHWVFIAIQPPADGLESTWIDTTPGM